MGQIQNSLARHISNLMIESYRFDPLHSSTMEQAIFDQIPQWLTRLRWEPDLSVRLASDHGEHPCILRRDAIRALVGERLASVRAFLEKWRGCSLLLSHVSGLLTGLVDEFADAEIAGQTAGTQRCLLQRAEILDQVDDLYRVRALFRIEPDASSVRTSQVNGERLATHLLCDDRALPLNRPVSIRIGENGPQISSELDDSAALTIVMRNRCLETLHLATDVSLPQTCRPGDSIRIGGHELRLIRVRDD
jgi:hypothetical protein